MNNPTNKIMELLEQGRVVVAKQGEKADPEQLAAAVLEYCEAAGYTLREVEDMENGIYRGVKGMFDRCRQMKFSGHHADGERSQSHCQDAPGTHEIA